MEPVPNTKEELNRLCSELEDHLNENKKIFDRVGNYRETFNLRWAFKVGEATVDPGFKQYVGSHQGFVLHTFKNAGVCIKSVEERLTEICGGDDELYDAMVKAHHIASQIFLLIDPEYTEGYYTINFSCMDDEQLHYVGKHKDPKDITFQYLLGLGKYSGAWIRTCGKDINYRHRIIKMDGRLDHEVVMEKFEGTRFAVIAYKGYDERIKAPTPILEQPEIVFSMDDTASDPSPVAIATGKKRKRIEEAPLPRRRERHVPGMYAEYNEEEKKKKKRKARTTTIEFSGKFKMTTNEEG